MNKTAIIFIIFVLGIIGYIAVTQYTKAPTLTAPSTSPSPTPSSGSTY